MYEKHQKTCLYKIESCRILSCISWIRSSFIFGQFAAIIFSEATEVLLALSKRPTKDVKNVLPTTEIYVVHLYSWISHPLQ